MIRPRTLFAALAAALFLTAPVLAQTPAPRDTVAAAAAEIRARYFSAERGDAIAAALEAEAASGRYDALTDPRDLAAALSERLRPEDAHFSVAYDPNAPRPVQGPPPGAGAPSPTDRERLANYGFRRIETLPGNVAVIEMSHFADIDFDDPADPARRAADAVLALASGADAVIFDLRANGGGSPAMVGYLVSAFTPADADIYNVFHSRQGTSSEAPAVFHPSPRLDTPLYVLTSARTGSAAEAFPYTLQAAGRAVVVGEASGGAANPGGMVPLPGGYRIFISGGSPVNPITGGNWEGTGVVPDVAASWDAALDRARALALARIDSEPARRSLAALEARPEGVELADYAGAYGPTTLAVEDGRLVSRRGRRPPTVLAPLERDRFYVVADPTVHYVFERDGDGRVVALEQRPAFGTGPRLRRGE